MCSSGGPLRSSSSMFLELEMFKGGKVLDRGSYTFEMYGFLRGDVPYEISLARRLDAGVKRKLVIDPRLKQDDSAVIS